VSSFLCWNDPRPLRRRQPPQTRPRTGPPDTTRLEHGFCRRARRCTQPRLRQQPVGIDMNCRLLTTSRYRTDLGCACKLGSRATVPWKSGHAWHTLAAWRHQRRFTMASTLLVPVFAYAALLVSALVRCPWIPCRPVDLDSEPRGRPVHRARHGDRVVRLNGQTQSRANCPLTQRFERAILTISRYPTYNSLPLYL